MRRSISFDLESPQGFQEYLGTCAEIFNCYAEHFHTNQKKNSEELKKLYYKLRKEFPLIPSAVVQGLRDSTLEACKGCKFKFLPKKKPTSGVRYTLRAISWKGNRLTLAYKIGEKRLTYFLTLPKFFRERYAEWKFQSGVAGWNNKKNCLKIFLSFQTDDPQQSTGSSVLGLDRGIYNLVTTSEGERFSSAPLRKIKRKHNHLRMKLQSLGTRSAKRRLKALSGRENGSFCKPITLKVISSLM
jgi:putative transposase